MVRLVRTALIGAVLALASVLVLVLALPGPSVAPPSPSATPMSTARPTPAPDRLYDTGTIIGPDYDPDLTSGPTRSKSQSKVWFHDGRWWGLLLAPVDGEFRIFGFDPDERVWVDTGTPVDSRHFVRADIHWDGTSLLVLSAGGNTDSGRHAAQLTRFSYVEESGTWTLDAGFPVTVTDAGTGPITIARDGTGVLWLTYVTDNQVMIAATDGDDHRWSDPTPLPAERTAVAADEAAVVAFDGGVGVMWSNQLEEGVYYVAHADGDPIDAWSPTEVAIEGLGVADNHVSIRSIRTDDGPVMVAVTKTSLDSIDGVGPLAPLVLLLVRAPDGTWTSSMVGRVGDRHTRPALVIEDGRRIHVFATSPFDGGEIFHKEADLEDLVFEPGLGDVFLSTAPTPLISNVSVPEQDVDGSTGMIIIAGDDDAGHYVTRAVSLGGQPFPVPRIPAVGRGDRLLIHNRFDAWPDREPDDFGWTVRGGTLSVEATDASAVVRLAAGDDGASLCRRFAGLPETGIMATAVVRVDSFGSARSSLMRLRAGPELLNIRVRSDGQLDYTVGTERREGPIIAAGTPLRIVVDLSPDGSSYGLTITHASTDAPILRDADLPIGPPDDPVDEICFEASPNSAPEGIVIDEVIVARVE